MSLSPPIALDITQVTQVRAASAIREARRRGAPLELVLAKTVALHAGHGSYCTEYVPEPGASVPGPASNVPWSELLLRAASGSLCRCVLTMLCIEPALNIVRTLDPLCSAGGPAELS